ncbi:MAG: PAS domain-containing protein [Rhodospirillaceae bacterium]|jgi:PAS domain S-box-containing protein|nr:PAS domain-containing protein [Rhodospirillaceae bacterium]MBT4689528.1 PAS domain-containing protein [Rhodospirillaceae bacterium]MBT5080380.1 PAS domain-containing protein [Rhodospirillaceae bacterium]MBT5522738.1 PAS domain-containing protein [Rhodospirillaceae bacterium]MBT5878474.1 PAS domain-containing protein [Rhodospirillaceae bacterium]
MQYDVAKIGDIGPLPTQNSTGKSVVADSESVRRRLLDVARVFDQVPVGFCIVDADLRYVYVNDAIVAFNGASREDHIGHTIAEVLPHSAARIEEKMRQVMTTTAPVVGDKVQYESKPQPGTIVYGKTTYSAILDEQGRAIGATALITDLTEQEIAESGGREDCQTR